jgi:hypothetical protein
MIATNSKRRAAARFLPSALRTLTRCLVCGSREVRTDEVVDRGVLLLNECPRCDHRWTRPPLAPLIRPAQDLDAPEAA